MNDLSILDQLHFLGIRGQVTSGGRELTAPCPFHNDKHPSFRVGLANGLWICHAGCGSGNWQELYTRLCIDVDWQPLEALPQAALPAPVTDLPGLEAVLARG